MDNSTAAKMDDLMRAHFFEHGNLELDSEGRDRCHFCQLRKFSTHKKCPVSLINEVDKEAMDPAFRFIEDAVMGDGIEIAEDVYRTGCECADDADCIWSDCHCLQEMERDQNGGRHKSIAYDVDEAQAGLLRGRILAKSREPIYECHSRCQCSPLCPNRVVERGRTIPLVIFKTKTRGWGVRSPVAIRKGQYIDKYVGEVITNEEANRRRDESNIAQRKDVYLFDLDKFHDPESLDERLRRLPYVVDGEFMSGPTRFINHSCEPNLRIFARVGDHVDKPIHDLAFFAIKDIVAGEELTFDYVDGNEDEQGNAKDPKKNKDMTVCLCKSKNCRGYLW